MMSHVQPEAVPEQGGDTEALQPFIPTPESVSKSLGRDIDTVRDQIASVGGRKVLLKELIDPKNGLPKVYGEVRERELAFLLEVAGQKLEEGCTADELCRQLEEAQRMIQWNDRFQKEFQQGSEAEKKEKIGFLRRLGRWIKRNPGKTLLIAVSMGTAGYVGWYHFGARILAWLHGLAATAGPAQEVIHEFIENTGEPTPTPFNGPAEGVDFSRGLPIDY